MENQHSTFILHHVLAFIACWSGTHTNSLFPVQGIKKVCPNNNIMNGNSVGFAIYHKPFEYVLNYVFLKRIFPELKKLIGVGPTLLNSPSNMTM